jgi:DNA-binding CsgD family transcriptional regulator
MAGPHGLHRREARGTLDEALETLRRLGAPLWAEKGGTEISRISGRTPGTVVLTPTEERIAILVVQGRSNREVADSLFLTVKTVEWNLSRIYRKLGIRSRVELARWLEAPRSSLRSPSEMAHRPT